LFIIKKIAKKNDAQIELTPYQNSLSNQASMIDRSISSFNKSNGKSDTKSSTELDPEELNILKELLQ